MSVIGPVLFGIGLALCWVIGRHIRRFENVLVPVTTALFGIAGLITGFADIWDDNFIWALVVLAAYGAVGSIVYRAGRSGRGQSE